MSETIVIGAGPYGLSIAAHLRARGVDFRIFGRPMSNWREKMPAGMLLKSDGYASSLDAPDGGFTLGEFSRQHGLRYADEGVPVPVENFIAYGEAFQRRFVPGLDQRFVTGLERTADHFAVHLEDGEIVTGRKVVIAVGVSAFAYVPPVFAGLPRELLTHASDYGALDGFRGREVAVVGSGSSAIDIAALLHENGAAVQLLARRSELRFHSPCEPGRRRWVVDGRRPNTGIGPGCRNVFYVYGPHLFRHLPEEKRHRIVNNTLGPSGGWFMRERLLGKVAVSTGLTPIEAKLGPGRVALKLATQDGGERTVVAEHVIAATGYRIDLRSIRFLEARLREQIKSVEHAPVLSANFETSVPGLYVAGPAAAYSFGPLLRFVYGAGFVAPRLARHLAGAVQPNPFVRGAQLADSQPGAAP